MLNRKKKDDVVERVMKNYPKFGESAISEFQTAYDFFDSGCDGFVLSQRAHAAMQDYKDAQVNVWFERGFFFFSGLCVGIFSGIGTSLVFHFLLG